jgi:hypothetical protein
MRPRNFRNAGRFGSAVMDLRSTIGPQREEEHPLPYDGIGMRRRGDPSGGCGPDAG